MTHSVLGRRLLLGQVAPVSHSVLERCLLLGVTEPEWLCQGERGPPLCYPSGLQGIGLLVKLSSFVVGPSNGGFLVFPRDGRRHLAHPPPFPSLTCQGNFLPVQASRGILPGAPRYSHDVPMGRCPCIFRCTTCNDTGLGALADGGLLCAPWCPESP